LGEETMLHECLGTFIGLVIVFIGFDSSVRHPPLLEALLMRSFGGLFALLIVGFRFRFLFFGRRLFFLEVCSSVAGVGCVPKSDPAL
jgi:drug/metabolite transporter (DMT)-like permease